MGKLAKEMKCPVCNGAAKLVTDDTELLGGKVVLKKNEFYKCEKCGEEFATAGQVRTAEQTLRKAFFFKRNLISTGGSLAITLPTDLSKYYSLKKGKSIELVPESEKEIKLIVD